MTAPAPPPPPPTCPFCGGVQWVGDPRGVLLLDHTFDCGLKAREDETALADYRRLGNEIGYDRPVTDTERLLLVAVGMPADLAAAPGLLTTVESLTDSMTRRTWPWPTP